MERSDFLAAVRQLAAAAEILARSGPPDLRFDAFELLALFRKFDRPAAGVGQSVVVSDDALFTQTAQAALALGGRNEFAASYLLLEQARSLLKTP